MFVVHRVPPGWLDNPNLPQMSLDRTRRETVSDLEARVIYKERSITVKGSIGEVLKRGNVMSRHSQGAERCE